MSGIRWPVLSTYDQGITQAFGHTGIWAEPDGYLQTDAHGPKRYLGKPFPLGVPKVDVHDGVDIGCVVGSPLAAVEDGVIVAEGTYTNTGEHYLMLEIRPGTLGYYTHLSGLRYGVGKRVTRGQTICFSGASGHVTGPHLHFEIRTALVPGADPFRSYDRTTWFRWNAARLRVGGDLAGADFIKPL